MAKNRVFQGLTDTLSLPVADGTVAGDAVLIGALVGVALTDKATTAADSNPIGEATVQVVPSAVFEFPVTGNNGVAAAIAVGDRVYRTAAGDLNSNSGGAFFGYALEPVASGATTTIRVKLTAS